MFRFGKAKATRKDRLRLQAMKTRDLAAEAASKAQAVAGPTVQKAGSAIAPKVSAARTKVTDDLMPLALAMLASAAERSRPARTEARARSVAMWRALLGEYAALEQQARKSHRVRNTVLVMGGLSAAAIAGLAASKRSRGPEWMQNGSEEPYATAARPESATPAGTSSPMAAATSEASSPPSVSASEGDGSMPEHGTSRQTSDDTAGASPDEAIADKAETAFGAFDADRRG